MSKKAHFTKKLIAKSTLVLCCLLFSRGLAAQNSDSGNAVFFERCLSVDSALAPESAASPTSLSEECLECVELVVVFAAENPEPRILHWYGKTGGVPSDTLYKLVSPAWPAHPRINGVGEGLDYRGFRYYLKNSADILETIAEAIPSRVENRQRTLHYSLSYTPAGKAISQEPPRNYTLRCYRLRGEEEVQAKAEENLRNRLAAYSAQNQNAPLTDGEAPDFALLGELMREPRTVASATSLAALFAYWAQFRRHPWSALAR